MEQASEDKIKKLSTFLDKEGLILNPNISECANPKIEAKVKEMIELDLFKIGIALLQNGEPEETKKKK